jgi:hypothetical protein
MNQKFIGIFLNRLLIFLFVLLVSSSAAHAFDLSGAGKTLKSAKITGKQTEASEESAKQDPSDENEDSVKQEAPKASEKPAKQETPKASEEPAKQDPAVSSSNTPSKDDKKNAGFLEKQVDRLEKYLDENSIESAQRTSEKAEKYYEKISPGYQGSTEVSALKTRLDTLNKKLADIESKAQAAGALANTLYTEGTVYTTIIKPHLDTFYMLAYAKEGDVSRYREDELAKLKEQLPAFKAFESEFRSKLPNLIEHKPDYAYDGITVSDFLDAFENADLYGSNFASLQSSGSLDSFIELLSGDEADLKRGNGLAEIWMEDLYGSKAGAPFDEVKSAQEKAKKEGVTLPQEKLEAIAAYKPKLRSLLEETAAKNSWKDSKASDYPYKSGALEKLLVAVEKNSGFKLVQYGTTPEDKWEITKNALGIPLYKSSPGFALFQKKGEPFLRGYSIHFSREFNGNGYDPVKLEMGNHIWPYAN